MKRSVERIRLLNARDEVPRLAGLQVGYGRPGSASAALEQECFAAVDGTLRHAVHAVRREIVWCRLRRSSTGLSFCADRCSRTRVAGRATRGPELNRVSPTLGFGQRVCPHGGAEHGSAVLGHRMEPFRSSGSPHSNYIGGNRDLSAIGGR